jgi:hypothetical protein
LEEGGERVMKKLIALMLLGVFIASVAIGCGEKTEEEEVTEEVEEAAEEE